MPSCFIRRERNMEKNQYDQKKPGKVTLTRNGRSLLSIQVMPLKYDEADTIILTLFSSPKRVALIDLLIRNNDQEKERQWLCVQDLANCLELSSSSHIIRKLKDIGLLLPQNRGSAIYYQINKRRWQEIKDRYSELFRLNRS